MIKQYKNNTEQHTHTQQRNHWQQHKSINQITQSKHTNKKTLQ